MNAVPRLLRIAALAALAVPDPTPLRAQAPDVPKASAAGAAPKPQPRPADEEGADVRIVFWYDRKRPLDTFRYQVYDLRRKEYTPAVDRWLDQVRKQFPGYEAYPRDVDLRQARGDTDKHKVGAAILDEFLVLGASRGYDFGPVGGAGRLRLPLSSPPPTRTLTTPTPTFRPVSPPVSTAPFPVPFPRPHP